LPAGVHRLMKADVNMEEELTLEGRIE